ncbi:MAG: hypothetical protein J07HQX50_02718 [Haloquadratum sp. J07HQX50]|jgi:Uncharacterized membrane-associated protein/domain|nr:MAG: hypothetical protein J07HQX50_02718 [Haloquadratum sp. J07HQX50]
MRFLAFICFLFLLSTVAGAGGAHAVNPPAAGFDSGLYQQMPADEQTKQTAVSISVQDDMSAFWQVEVLYPLESNAETAAIQTVARQYEAGQANVGPQVELFRTLRRVASAQTGREMQMSNVSYRANVSDTQAQFILSFRWADFAQSGPNGTMIVGDVFDLPTAESDREQTWLSIVGPDQQIVIQPPERYTVKETSIAVQQQRNAIVLAEPTDFIGDNALRVTYSPVEEESAPLSQTARIAAVFAGILVLLVGGWRFSRRRGASTENGNGGSNNDGPSGAAQVSQASSEDESVEETSDVPEVQNVGSEFTDPALLSDEERVEQLLSQNGGRMRQATIVDETGWSDAKVSQLLSSMAASDRIDKLRLGRENLISLPETDVTESQPDDANQTRSEG